jgi:hypothetical protein
VFDDLLDRFVQMVWKPSAKTLDRFYRLAETAYRKHRNEEAIASELAVILASRPIAQAYLEEWDASALDPAIPAFVEHASIWTARLSAPFTIIHDVSKPLVNDQLILEAMMSETEPTQTIGYDRRKQAFPIAAREIVFADSASHPQLQIADLLASARAYSLRTPLRKQRDPFAQELLKTRALSIPFRPLWPEQKITPDELGTNEVGGTDANQYVGDYIANRLGGIPPRGQRRKPPEPPAV